MNNNKISNLHFLQHSLIEWSSDKSEETLKKRDELLELLKNEEPKINKE